MRQLALRLVLALSAAAPVTSVHAAACGDALFVDQVAPAAWHTIELQPSQGTAGLRAALQSAGRDHADVPVRIRLAAGRYPDNIGSEVFAQRLQRSASAPIHIVAADPRPNATVLGHGLNLLGVSYIAIEGLTIGPEQVGAWDGQRHADPQPLQAAAGVHVAGAALEARRNAAAGSAVDFAIYGRYEPSHHIVVRRVTVQNLFGSDERDGETSESQNMDGMKFNQVQDLWVLDSRVDQTTRHGIDLVGVHRAAICRTLISRSGGGLGIEAKGGSVDVLYDSNTFYRVRRVELGGEDTDATYYMSADGRWDYEALRTVARHNLVIDAREAALEFSGCLDCTAIGNTVYFSAAYRPPGDGQDIQGGDAIRVHDSRVLAAEDGAGSDCQTWDPNLQDYVTVDPCWGVGARPPAPVNRVLRSDTLTLVNNSSNFASWLRCTSSGPSARRSVRFHAYIHASGNASDTPPPPCAWIAQSITCCAMFGATILIIAISARAALLPTVSIIDAALSVSSRACSMRQRDSAMRSCQTDCSDTGLPNATRGLQALAHEFERALGLADDAHAVVDAARPEAALRDLEAAAFAEQHVGRRDPDVLEHHFHVTVRRVVVAEHRQVTHDRHARRIAGTSTIDCCSWRFALSGSVLPIRM
jgi:hypothetical protein